MRTIAVMNEKGGTGKTTTTISLAAVLAERGLCVLVVDLDPQASASLWMGRGREPGLYRAIAERADLRPYVRSTAVPGIDLIIDDVLARLRTHGAELVGELEQYEDSYRLCYVRGPEGIIVALAEQMN